jgi:hypothetical protein
MYTDHLFLRKLGLLLDCSQMNEESTPQWHTMFPIRSILPRARIYEAFSKKRQRQHELGDEIGIMSHRDDPPRKTRRFAPLTALDDSNGQGSTSASAEAEVEKLNEPGKTTVYGLASWYCGRN